MAESEQSALERLTRLLHKATRPPWIRPWAMLEVHAPGADDLFGRNLGTSAETGAHAVSVGNAQANIDLAVAAVNWLASLHEEPRKDATEALIRHLDSVKRSGTNLSPDSISFDMGVATAQDAIRAYYRASLHEGTPENDHAE